MISGWIYTLLTNRWTVAFAMSPGAVMSVILVHGISPVASIVAMIVTIWFLSMMYKNLVLRYANTSLKGLSLYIFFIIAQIGFFVIVGYFLRVSSG